MPNKSGQLTLDDNKFRRQDGNPVPPWQIQELAKLQRAAKGAVEAKDREREAARTEGTSPSSVSRPRPGDAGGARLVHDGFGERSDASKAAGGRWREEPAKSKAPIIYSGLLNDKIAPPPKPTDPKPFTEFEARLAAAGINVLKLRELNLDQARAVQKFYYDTKPGVGPGRSGAVMADAAKKGLFAVPDEQVSDAFDRLVRSRDNRGRIADVSSNNGAMQTDVAASIVADYLTTNREMAMIREQVFDDKRMAALKNWQDAVDPRAGTSRPSDAKVEALAKTMRSTWGLQRNPTFDETEGLKLWNRYFKGRERDGERTVGNLLDTPFLKRRPN